MARVKLSRNLANVRYKLEHSAESEFSAHVTPEECTLLLAVVDRYLELEQEKADGSERLR